MIDIKDRKILSELEKNARQSNSQIGKRVGLSHDTVNYRIKRLESSGIIEGYYTIIDLMRIGHLYVRGWIKYHNISNEEEQEVIDFMIKTKKFGFVTSIGGRYDLGFSFNVSNLKELEKSIDYLLENKGQFFKELHYSIASGLYFFDNKFIMNKNDGNYIFIGKQKIDKKLSLVDLKLLVALSGEGRISLKELASKLNMNMNTLLKKIRAMEKEKIILGYRPKLNFSLLGYQYYKVFLVSQNITPKTINQMVTFAANHSSIIYMIKALDHAQIEYEIIVKSNEEFFEIIKQIKHRFKEVVKDIYFNQINKEYKSVYLS